MLFCDAYKENTFIDDSPNTKAVIRIEIFFMVNSPRYDYQQGCK